MDCAMEVNTAPTLDNHTASVFRVPSISKQEFGHEHQLQTLQSQLMSLTLPLFFLQQTQDYKATFWSTGKYTETLDIQREKLSLLCDERVF